MYGGRYDDWFYVDDAGDKVIERAGGGDDTVYSTIATIKLAANVENLFSDLWYDDVHATGNRLGNYIATQDGNDTVHGGGGNDYIETGAGADVVRGGAGDDILLAFHGTDRLYGGAGSDMLIGGFDADLLFGGKGDDVFTFEGSWDSTPSRRDMIGCADGVAFEGAGKAGGDLIDLRGLDADLTTPDFDFFVFGGTGKGHLSLVNRGSDTLVRGNVDDDGGFEFECLIRDGEVKASAYTAADFLLVWE
jgi:Ca2+-binding RTX toxin-like protein